MKLKRLLYLGYYLKHLDWKKITRFRQYAQAKTGKTGIRLWLESMLAVFRYNISLEEYYLFRFYEISEEEKEQYAGTGYMYEYQLKMNPGESRAILADKEQFLHLYKTHVHHDFVSLGELEKDANLVLPLLSKPSGKVVLKSSDGQCGRGIEVRASKDFTPETLIQRLRATGNDLVEDYVVQHEDLMELSPAGLNTVRVITQLDQEDNVHLLGARLRITINSAVDNLAAGNIAAPIDIATGKVIGPGVYSDITKEDEAAHPITKVKIIGFQVPFWAETIAMCKAAALLDTRNRSIGWDVAITEKGPELIEGNHDWCKLLWQLPVKQGLKPVLENS